MDTKDWDGFQATFAIDAMMDTTQEAPGSEIVNGRENIRRFVEGAVGPVVTVHHGHMPEIEIASETTARGVWAMQDFLKMPEGSPLGMKSMTGYGHYTETYELVDGEWLIKTLVLTRPAARRRDGVGGKAGKAGKACPTTLGCGRRSPPRPDRVTSPSTVPRRATV